ncbi:hypothetical protein Ahy_A10g050266 [Arachis hypogaea]|uniref:Uncharacterized protein n=1 Tax=Arachis hypogaea TaxID=3818 RepID=A0A445B8Z5_ARAHY|nr:hypothetical protein Ahy_A10g050266 [Arachis hypogaea]
MKGRLKFDDGKKEMKVYSDPFDSKASFAEPYLGVNMVRISYDFDMALENFESDVYNRFKIVMNPRIEMLITNVTHNGGTGGPPRGRYPYFHGKAKGYPRGRDRRGRQPPKVSPVDKGNRATLSVHSRIVLPTDRETYPKGVSSPVKLDKGKAVVRITVTNKDKGADLDEEYFEERDEEMVSTILIIPTEYLGEYEGDPEDAYDVDDEEAFLFIRYEDEPGYFQRPSEKQKFHLRPLHITATMNGIKVNKVLIDGREAISLLPERMIMKRIEEEHRIQGRSLKCLKGVNSDLIG